MATAKKKKTKVTKRAKPKPRPFSAVEDCFLKTNTGKASLEYIAKELKRTEKECVERMKELSDAEPKTTKLALKGFDVHPSGALSNTGARSYQDDLRENKIPDALRAKPFSEADDFFLKANADKMDMAEIAKSVNRTERECHERLAELSGLGRQPKVNEQFMGKYGKCINRPFGG